MSNTGISCTEEQLGTREWSSCTIFTHQNNKIALQEYPQRGQMIGNINQQQTDRNDSH